MKDFLVGLTIFIALMAGIVSYWAWAGVAPSKPSDAVVMIVSPGGHGSGVHIGDGFILTAAHVVGGQGMADLRVKAQDGSIHTFEVLWINKDYDVALLRVKPVAAARIATAGLSCRDPEVGEMVTAYGSPLDTEFLALKGYVAGSPIPWGPLKRVVPVDLSMIWGMSGGPTMDASGRVIGINSATMLRVLGMGATWLRVGFIVPGKTICELMGRA